LKKSAILITAFMATEADGKTSPEISAYLWAVTFVKNYPFLVAS
jgi:hypothetical protein